NPAAAEKARAAAAAQPPATASHRDNATFYVQRAQAANKIGLIAQEIADLRKALEYSTPGDPDRLSVVFALVVAESLGGNFAEAIELLTASMPSSGDGARFLFMVALARRQAEI